MFLQGTNMGNFSVINGNDGQSFQLGDYVFGNLDEVMNRIMQMSGPQGPPPTSKKLIEALPVIKINDEKESCAVCKDTFKMDEDAIQLPCKHVYHKDCILPWLERNNTCPVCRHELETDDKDYEKKKKDGNGQGQNQRPSNTRPQGPPSYFV